LRELAALDPAVEGTARAGKLHRPRIFDRSPLLTLIGAPKVTGAQTPKDL
jgi:hypothetical protein